MSVGPDTVELKEFAFESLDLREVRREALISLVLRNLGSQKSYALFGVVGEDGEQIL